MPTGQKKAAPPKTRRADNTNTQTENTTTSTLKAELLALGVFVVGVLLFLSMVSDWIGIVGIGINSFLFGMFSYGAYAVVISLLIIAVNMAIGVHIKSMRFKMISLIIVTISISAIIQIINGISDWATLKDVATTWTNGAIGTSGGLMGALIGIPLFQLTGKVGSLIILFFLLIAGFMMITGLTIYSIKTHLAKLKGNIVEASESLQKRREIEMEKRQKLNSEKEIARLQEKKLIEQELHQRELLAQQNKKEGSEIQTEPSSDSIFVIGGENVAINTKTGEVFDGLNDTNKDDINNNKNDNSDVLHKILNDDDDEDDDDDIDISVSNDKNPRVHEENGQLKIYTFPPVSLLNKDLTVRNLDMKLSQDNSKKLIDTLRSFGVEARVLNVSYGPAVTRYEIQPSPGVKISKITSLSDDLALNLAARSIRIEAPIPGKAAIGIELPNAEVQTVFIRELIDSPEFTSMKSKLAVALGNDVAGAKCIIDITRMPHLLIAGSTGSGKSVCVNSIIISLIYKSTPDEVKFLLIDPKKVELSGYNGIPHLIVPVITDPKKAAGALNWAVNEMTRRYTLFNEKTVRDIAGFNALAAIEDIEPMPQIVIIIDELADLMMVAANEIEDYICRLAQMARAAGMHLIIATQRPSVDVVTGLIKANVPSRIAFATASQIDSRTILDQAGAEKLLGRGDMLYNPIGASKPRRVQGCFVSESEIEQIVNFVKQSGSTQYREDVIEHIDRNAYEEKRGSKLDKRAGDGDDDGSDDKLEAAIDCVIENGGASTSLLQRRLRLGYAHAARIIDELADRGIVGPYEGSKPRQVLMTRSQWQEMKMRKMDIRE